MSIRIYENQLIINIPNSEASINAQHTGIKNRTVGQYYMSDKYHEVINFLNNLEGNFYIDFSRTYNYMKPMIDELVERELEDCFKCNLKTQISALETFSWLITNEEDLTKIETPIITETRKYLKFTTSNEYFALFRDICLGDLTSICIKKISNNTFLIYAKKQTERTKFRCINGEIQW